MLKGKGWESRGYRVPGCPPRNLRGGVLLPVVTHLCCGLWGALGRFTSVAVLGFAFGALFRTFWPAGFAGSGRFWGIRKVVCRCGLVLVQVLGFPS